MIQIENAKKVFHTKAGKVYALDNVSLSVEKGDIFGVIGYSGAGKSTLLRLVNGLEKPDSGKVVIDGKDITNLSKAELNGMRKNIGMVFQQFNLLESQTVYQNIALPLIMSGMKKKDIEARVEELLNFVGLDKKVRHMFLSFQADKNKGLELLVLLLQILKYYYAMKQRVHWIQRLQNPFLNY